MIGLLAGILASLRRGLFLPTCGHFRSTRTGPASSSSREGGR